MVENDTSKSLLQRLGDHRDAEAWTTFCDIYGPLIYKFSVSRGVQNNDAADIAQEVLIRLAKAIRSFEYDRNKGRFRDWLLRVTFNEIARWKSKGEPNSPSTLGDDEASVSREWSQQFEQHVLQTALERVRHTVEPDTWRLFDLTWLQGRSAKEVAEETGQKIEAVYHAKSRVLKKLRIEVLDLAEDACF